MTDFEIDHDALSRTFRDLLRFSALRSEQEEAFDSYREKYGTASAIRAKAEDVKREAKRNEHMRTIRRVIEKFISESQDDETETNDRYRLDEIKDRIEMRKSSVKHDLMTCNFDQGVREGKINFIRSAEDLIDTIKHADLQ